MPHAPALSVLSPLASCLLLVGAAFPQEAAAEEFRPYIRMRTSDVLRDADDLQTLARARQILLERGYTSEATRLEAINRDLEAATRARSIDARARALVAGDIHDKAVRVAILELALDGYVAAGWETNAEALGWFVALGRSQVDGASAEAPPMPASLRAGSGSIVDRMIELVLGAVGVHQQRGNPSAAACCLRLGRFYMERQLGAFRTEGVPPQPVSSARAPEPQKALGYLDGADEVDELPASPATERVEASSAQPPIDAASPLSAAEADHMELVRQLQTLRARVEELERKLAQERPPASGERRR